MTNTANVAVESDFYRLKELTPADLDLVEKLWIADAPSEMQQLLRGWIPGFTAVFELKRIMESTKPDNDQARLGERLDEAVVNLEEDLHAKIERDSAWLLESLRQHDLSFLTLDDDMAPFCHFLSVQFMRTNKMRSTMIDRARNVPGVSIENAWGLMSHVLATLLGYNLYSKRKTCVTTLLVTPTGSEFITSDQPVVNLRATHLPEGEEAKELEFYYPVAPGTALLLDFTNASGGVIRRTATPTEVDALNRSMLAHSHQQTFASNVALLEGLTHNP